MIFYKLLLLFIIITYITIMITINIFIISIIIDFITTHVSSNVIIFVAQSFFFFLFIFITFIIRFNLSNIINNYHLFTNWLLL